MNSISGPEVFARSLATRQVHLSLSRAVGDAVSVLRADGFDLIIVETAGIGQSDSEIVEVADASIYVMTPDYGAPSQLEKIDMLELADAIVLNKSDRRGAEDALRDVRKQWKRNHKAFDKLTQTYRCTPPWPASGMTRESMPSTPRCVLWLLSTGAYRATGAQPGTRSRCHQPLCRSAASATWRKSQRPPALPPENGSTDGRCPTGCCAAADAGGDGRRAGRRSSTPRGKGRRGHQRFGRRPCRGTRNMAGTPSPVRRPAAVLRRSRTSNRGGEPGRDDVGNPPPAGSCAPQ